MKVEVDVLGLPSLIILMASLDVKNQKKKKKKKKKGQTPRTCLRQILPPNTAIIDYYAICLEKLSANRQFFVGAQMAISS